MSWAYSGSQSLLQSLTVTTTSQFNGNARFGAFTRFDSNANFFGSTGLVNENYLKTAFPDTNPGPSGQRTTPNIQFQPRTLNGVVASGAGQDDQFICTLLPTGMVTVSGSLAVPQAARANGTVIADLNNTALEQRLKPSVNHRFIPDGKNNGTGVPAVIVLTPAGQFVLLNADTGTAGNLNYIFTGYWMDGEMVIRDRYYGNGGY